MEEALWKTAIQKVLKALEDSSLPPTPAYAWHIFEGPAREIGVDPKVLRKAALEEAKKWTEGVLDRLCKVLGIPPPTSLVRKALGWGQRIRVRCPRQRGAPRGEALVEVEGMSHVRHLSFPIVGYQPSEAFLLEAHAGRVEVRVAPKLLARKGRAFLRTLDGRGVEKALKEVRALRPLFLALDLGDLEGALKALSRLRDGEVWQEGRYVLVRRGRLRVLMRGTYFGDPLLDGAFLLGRRVTLAYENGVKVSLRAVFSDSGLRLEEASVRWGDEFVRLETAKWKEKDLLDETLPAHLFSRSVWWELKKGSPGHSLKMRGLIAELATSEDPFKTLGDKELPRRASLRGLSQL
jgi:hypothetical protein